MGMSVGQAQTDPVSGMSGEIWTSLASKMGLTAPQQLPAQTLGLRRICEAIAVGVISHIQNHATVTVGASVGALQRDNTAGNPATLGPGSDQTIPAPVVG